MADRDAATIARCAVGLWLESKHDGTVFSSEIGFGVGVGLVHRGSFFVEFKLGALDSPEAKIGVGWTFR